MSKAVLVTGGAGYIGSHVVRQLGEIGREVVVLDNLSTGFASSVLHGELVVGDTGDQPLVDRIMREHDVGAVMHFAAHTIVPESVDNPLKYYGNNTCNSRSLLECCPEEPRGPVHLLFDSCGVWYAGVRGRYRGNRHHSDQSVRHVQADDRTHAARSRAGERASLCNPALLQRCRV